MCYTTRTTKRKLITNAWKLEGAKISFAMFDKKGWNGTSWNEVLTVIRFAKLHTKMCRTVSVHKALWRCASLWRHTRGSAHLHVARASVSALNDRHRKLLEKHFQCPELTGEDEVEQRPQLLEVVLDRGSGQNESVWCRKLVSFVKRLEHYSVSQMPAIARKWASVGALGPLDFDTLYFLIDFVVEKCFSLSFELVTQNFTAVTTLEKSSVALTWEKPYRRPWVHRYLDAQLSLLLPRTHKGYTLLQGPFKAFQGPDLKV